MKSVSIAGQEIDADDPCAIWQALYAFKLKAITSTVAEEIEIRSPVTNRRVKFSGADRAAIDEELRSLARACEAKSGKRTRFAMPARVLRPY